MLEETTNRKFPRFRTNALVWWNRDWEPEPIALMDIGAGGMLCEFPSEVKMGERVNLSFELPGHENLIFCECRAVNVREGSTNNKFHLVGLQINHLEGMTGEAFISRLAQDPLEVVEES